MSYAKVFAKIILAAMGIFFILKFIPLVFQAVMFIDISKSLWPLLMNLFIIIAIILFLWYFFFHLRDWLAEKIVGAPTGYEFDEQTNWFPAALRLICIFAGLYCLSNAIWMVWNIIHLVQLYAKQGSLRHLSLSQTVEFFHISLLIPIGIYLVWGAPHFVRWQVKKTIEQCKNLQNSESALD